MMCKLLIVGSNEREDEKIEKGEAKTEKENDTVRQTERRAKREGKNKQRGLNVFQLRKFFDDVKAFDCRLGKGKIEKEGKKQKRTEDDTVRQTDSQEEEQ